MVKARNCAMLFYQIAQFLFRNHKKETAIKALTAWLRAYMHPG